MLFFELFFIGSFLGLLEKEESVFILLIEVVFFGVGSSIFYIFVI